MNRHPRYTLTASFILGSLIIGQTTTIQAMPTASQDVCSGGTTLPQVSKTVPNLFTVPANIPGILWRPIENGLLPKETQIDITKLSIHEAGSPQNTVFFSQVDTTTTEPLTLRFNTPLIAGKSYRISDTHVCQQGSISSPSIDGTFLAGKEVPLPTALGSLDASPTLRDIINVGLHKKTYDSVIYSDVSWKFNSSATPWKDALKLEVIIDGTPWKHPVPESIYLRPVLTEHPDAQRVVARVFSACGNTQASSSGLKEGKHAIVLRASLPGSKDKAVLETKAVEITLDCDHQGYCKQPSPSTVLSQSTLSVTRSALPYGLCGKPVSSSPAVDNEGGCSLTTSRPSASTVFFPAFLLFCWVCIRRRYLTTHV